MTSHAISRKFLEGTRVGATPVTRGVALPHLSIDDGLRAPEMVIVRANSGIKLAAPDLELSPDKDESVVTAIFFLISPKNNPGQHLRILAQIARRVDADTFPEDWTYADGEQGLKEALLMDEHFIYLVLSTDTKTKDLIGKSLREVHLPAGNLIPIIRRGESNIIPRGDTILEDGDRMTVIGEPDVLKKLKQQYTG